jgi:hypothetical protein
MIDRADVLKLVVMALGTAIVITLFALFLTRPAHAQYAAWQAYNRYHAYSNHSRYGLPPTMPPEFYFAFPLWDQQSRTSIPRPPLPPPVVAPRPDDPNLIPQQYGITKSEIEAAIVRLCDEHPDDQICSRLREQMRAEPPPPRRRTRPQ